MIGVVLGSGLVAFVSSGIVETLWRLISRDVGTMMLLLRVASVTSIRDVSGEVSKVLSV